MIRQPIADVYFFETKLNATGNTDDMRKLLQQNTTYPELLKKSLDPFNQGIFFTPSLGSKSASQLRLPSRK